MSETRQESEETQRSQDGATGAHETRGVGAEPPPGATPATTRGAPGQGEQPGKGRSLTSDAMRELRRNPLFIIPMLAILLMIVVAAFPQLFTSKDPRNCDLITSREPPSAEHWFGVDLQGCDYYTTVLYGARPSITIGIVTTAVAALIAVLLGTLAGYFGGWFDIILSRISDIFFGLPFILGALVILTVFDNRGISTVSLVLILLGWPTMTRLMRSSVLGNRDADYVNAARALGASDGRIMLRHVLPNAITPVLVYATVTVGIIISAEAVLSFLGVGLELPNISWGLQINVAQVYFLESPHLLFFPAILLSITVLSFIALGDAVRDAFDPKLR